VFTFDPSQLLVCTKQEIFTAGVRKGDPDSYVTTMSHNAQTEVIEWVLPLTNKIQRTFDSGNSNPLARGNLLEDEYFYTLTSDALLYYLTDRLCPTRFPVVYYAAPRQYQEEIVEDLDTKNVKLVIVTGEGGSNWIDGVNIGARSPLILTYVLNNYKPLALVGGFEIWTRK